MANKAELGDFYMLGIQDYLETKAEFWGSTSGGLYEA